MHGCFAMSGPIAACCSPGVVAMIVGGLADAALVKLLDPMVKQLFVNHDPTLVVLLPAALIVIFVVSGLASFASGYSTQWVSQKVILDLRREMFAKVLRLPPGYFDEVATASLVTKFTNDVNNLSSASTSVLTVLVRDTVTIVALMAILLWSNWKLTLITFLVIPPIAVVVRAFSRRLRAMSRETQRAMGGVAEVLDEAIANQRVVRVFGGQDYESKRFENASQRIRRFTMKQAVAAAGTVPVTQLFVACAIAAIIYFAAQQASAGTTDVGHFLEFIAATGMLLQPLKRLTGINEWLQKGLAACESVFGLIDEPPEDDRGTVDTRPRARRDPLRERVAHLQDGLAPGAGRAHARDRARRDRGTRGPVRRRQVEPDPPAAALLPSAVRPRDDRWPRPRGAQAGEPAAPGLARVAERRALQRHGRRQHRLRPRRERSRSAHRRRGRGRARDGVHPRVAAGTRTPPSARTARSFRADSASASRSRARSSRTRRSCCSTRRPRRSIRKASAPCRPRSTR